jgi:hypothetical protein
MVFMVSGRRAGTFEYGFVSKCPAQSSPRESLRREIREVTNLVWSKELVCLMFRSLVVLSHLLIQMLLSCHRHVFLLLGEAGSQFAVRILQRKEVQRSADAPTRNGSARARLRFEVPPSQNAEPDALQGEHPARMLFHAALPVTNHGCAGTAMR